MRAIVTGALQATPEDLAALEALGLTVAVHPDERAAVEKRSSMRSPSATISSASMTWTPSPI